MLLHHATAQVDTLSQDTTQLLRSNPELQFSGDTFISGKDTVALPAAAVQDTTMLADTTEAATDSLASRVDRVKPRGDIETTINYTARDSMLFDLENQKLYLYGETHIDYGYISLDADQTNVNWVNRTIQSRYTMDTLGRKQGKPVFTQGTEVYETDDILYNFQTKRAIIKGVITEQDGAFMHGEDVMKNEENELFIRGAKYTTCNLSDPHFFIESTKLKAIPGNKVISGPFNLKFREVPTPLWFPFGMFPQPRKKATGIVFPSYGEERLRGFFLRDGGYYFAFNEYADLRLTGDIYSKGGYVINANTNYKVRYKFNGSFNLSHTRLISDNIERPQDQSDYWIRWSHRPESRGNSSFSASVSAGTSSYNNNNNLAAVDFQRSINSQFASNISYSQKLRGTPFNLSANGRHTQNVSTGIYTMALPDFTLNMNRIYPLKGLVKSSNHPLAKVSFSHNFVAKNEFSNAPIGRFPFQVDNEGPRDTLEFSFDELDKVYDRARVGGRHTIPLSTSFNLLKYFTVNPNFNYNEVWYTRELRFSDYDAELGGVQVDTVEGFSRAGSWNSGASLNTRVYGMYYIRGIKSIEAIRHVMTPSLSFSYSPDFGSESRGVYQTIVTDSTGRTQRVSKYEGFAYGSPTGNEVRSLSLSLTNNLEMKVRTKNDSVNEFKKVKIFDNLSMNTGYNFAADSFRLSNISWNTRTSFFNQKVSVNLSGQFDPYLYEENGTATGRRVDRYTWNNGQGLGNLRSLSTAVTFSLKPKSAKKTNEEQSSNPMGYSQMGTSAFDDPSQIMGSEFGTEEEKAYVMQNPDEYVDFNLPWSLNVSYNISRGRTGLADPNITSHGMQVRGTLGLTGKTQITFNTGYDFNNKDFTQTRIGIDRDLHCWTLQFSWVPFGRYQSFNLTIRPKSSLLQDLKIERRRNFFDFFQD